MVKGRQVHRYRYLQTDFFSLNLSMWGLLLLPNYPSNRAKEGCVV